MEQEKMRQEMEAVMKQLSPDRQRQLLELAQAFKKAEDCLDAPSGPLPDRVRPP